MTDETDETEEDYYPPPSKEEDIYAVLFEQQIMTIPREAVQYVITAQSGAVQ